MDGGLRTSHSNRPVFCHARPLSTAIKNSVRRRTSTPRLPCYIPRLSPSCCYPSESPDDTEIDLLLSLSLSQQVKFLPSLINICCAPCSSLLRFSRRCLRKCKYLLSRMREPCHELFFTHLSFMTLRPRRNGPADRPIGNLYLAKVALSPEPGQELELEFRPAFRFDADGARPTGREARASHLTVLVLFAGEPPEEKESRAVTLAVSNGNAQQNPLVISVLLLSTTM
ncbi:hypothetical protein B0T19DRAFT_421736 [Cercophora scortea]|uniref:Uncharacterized protein n=1 Tax=Cercophora scortea TaxID=314031 RepID=A0AAE0ILY3_9PEZI|nr:hypothetical protein B0T19DRAFT_421736 [Cercophora scortea]